MKNDHKVLTDAFMESLLAAHPAYFNEILEKRDSFRVQIIYTRIDRKKDNTPVFKPYYFNVNPDSYFYPASTVKMPVAILSLERLNDLGITGLDKHTIMHTEAAYSGQTAVLNDPTSPDGSPSVAQYIRKIFLVSDNDAYNRLYEFLGQEYINRNLWEKGYANANILHRLEIAMTEEENRATNPVRFLDRGGNLVYQQPLVKSKLPYPARNDSAGIAHYAKGNLVYKPFDFSAKNRFTLEDLNTVLRSVLFPASVPEKQRFRLSADDRRFLLQYMSQLPRETAYPQYDAENYWDSYVKFVLFGSEKQASPLPGNIRIFNKVGDAYGFLTDVAYVVDFEKGIEFMLSATIYCNSDGVLNDNNYDYEKTGWPFLKHLGKVIYDMEAKRKKEVKPDLSELRLNYGNEK